MESFGYFNPHQNIIEANPERINYWLGKGASPSETVHNLLITKGVIQGEKVQVTKPKKKPAPSAEAPSTGSGPSAQSPAPTEPATTPAPAPETPAQEPPKEEVQS